MQVNYLWFIYDYQSHILDQIDYTYSANLTLNQMIEGKVLQAFVHGFYNDTPCVELFYKNEETDEVAIYYSLYQFLKTCLRML